MNIQIAGLAPLVWTFPAGGAVNIHIARLAPQVWAFSGTQTTTGAAAQSAIGA